MTDRKRPIKPGEMALWQSAMEGAHKADKKKVAPRATPKPLGPAGHQRREAAQRLEAPKVEMGLKPRPLGPQPIKKEVGLDGKNAERLRKGKIDIEARLDLHGLTQARAYDVLVDFIHRQYGAGKRCVLVITGKGKGRDFRGMPREVADTPWERKAERFEMPTGSGVLREIVPRWLGEPSLRPYVVSHSQAQPRHGGSGAIYVYLRRDRSR